MAVFTIEQLTFLYPEQEKAALCDVNLQVEQGAFLVLCGPSGCGKSTLLRQLKTALAPHGRRSGTILFEGQPLEDVDFRTQSQRIGFVQQSPEHQIVTDKVWHELAFGLESLGYDTPTIRRRVAEMASFFGIQTWFHKETAALSGGQKQLVNLAAVMVMQPDVLILDEPTAQLDPIAAADFLAVLGKINRELGTTIVITEHRLEEVFPLASSVAVMDQGHILCVGTPNEVGQQLKAVGHSMFLAMPAAMRIWAAVENEQACPVTVGEGRDWLAAFAQRHTLQEVPEEIVHTYSEEVLLSVEDVWFKYEKDLPDVVKGLQLSVKRGEFVALLGGNGTGKTTSLKVLAGLLQPYRGKVGVYGTVCVLPQNPQTLFVKKTVREDLLELLREQTKDKAAQEKELARVVQLCGLTELLERHPYDLSGGEQQRAALAKILLRRADILLLDEPTKGLDAEFKQVFAGILQALGRQGMTVLMVSHDIEFCARYAHRCALFFDGNIVTEGTPHTFFSGNHFYTTAANRMAKALLPTAVTTEDVIAACGGTVPPVPDLPETDDPLPQLTEIKEQKAKEKLPRWRRLLAAVSGIGAAGMLLLILRSTDLHAALTADGMTPLAMQQFALYGGLLFCLAFFAVSTARRSCRSDYLMQLPQERRKLSKRTRTAAFLILLLIPLTLFVGEAYFDGRKYALIAFLLLLEMMLPFLLVFEGRKPQARELVIIAVLCAIGVAGRAVLFMLPECKPVLALTIIAAVAFGGETGFMVGAVTMLVSNMMLAQGPWTPWQMFAMGIIGFLAGILFRKGILNRNREALCVFGALSALLIYGCIMNTASALMWASELSWDILLSSFLTGFPMDCIHAGATVLFLWFAAEPMLEKLDRVKVKYGLIE